MMNKQLASIVAILSLLLSLVTVSAATSSKQFYGTYEYNGEESILQGIVIGDNYLQVVLNIKEDAEEDPFAKSMTQIINLDYQTMTDVALTGKVDPEKEASEETNNLPTMQLHFANTENWQYPFIMASFTEVRYELNEETLFVSYKDQYLFKLTLDDNGNLVNNDEQVLTKVE